MITIVRGEIIGGTRLVARLGRTEAAHAVDRCLKRVERVVAGFRGKLLRSGDGQTTTAFLTPEEACLAAIEMQRRVTDLPPVSGVKLTIRLGVHGAADEDGAASVAGQLLELALPDQIMCSKEIILNVARSTGIRVRDLNQVELSGGGAFQVMELIWHQVSEDEVPSTLTSTALLAFENLENTASSRVHLDDHSHDVSRRFCMRFNGRAHLLDEKNPFITLGREFHNDVIIDDSKVSRHHARIERRDGRFYLVDTSTNGTFVTFANEPEVFLRMESMPLRGAGIFSFGVSARDANIGVAEFEHM